MSTEISTRSLVCAPAGSSVTTVSSTMASEAGILMMVSSSAPIIEASRMPTPKPKVVVVMPAYNAQHTIEKTWREVVAHDVVDLVVVVDDASQDDTVKLARGLDRVVVHVH